MREAQHGGDDASWPLGPWPSRAPASHAKKRAEARARPGHERVVVDAMAFEPLADAPPASLPIHNFKQPSFFVPARFCPGSLSSFHSFVAADPRARGLAERRETSSLVCVAQVTRDATLAGMGPPAQPGGPPHGAPPWRCRPRSRLRPRCRVRREGSTPPWHVCQAAVAGLFVSAVTSRGRRHIPLRLQDRFWKAPLMSGMWAI